MPKNSNQESGVSLRHAYGECHALTAALLQIAPSGQAFGLFCKGTCVHSAFRVPHTQTFVDAFGAEVGESALSGKAARYVRPGDDSEWRALSEDEVVRMISGNRTLSLRRARAVALGLLRAADGLAA